MTNKNKFPAIRFKGFDDAWEQRKFDEVFDCTIPNNTLSRAELNYESGSVRNIHYGDILIKYGSVVDVQNDEIPFATGKSSDDFKGALLQDGDIIIADTAEDETTGKACEVGNSQGLDVVSGLHTMVCRPRNKMALGYLGYYLNSDAYHHQLLPLMQGIKVLSLSRTNVQKTMVCYPKSKTEQQLIADCFRNLDHLITLHQRKLDKLHNTKKACLEKMFPKNGSNVPEIRFAGFTEAWEQRELGSITSSYSGGTPTAGKAEYYDGDIPFIRSGEINEEKTELFLSELGYKNSSAAMVEKGDILYALYGATSGEVSISKLKGAINQAILAIKPNEGYDSEFLMQWLRNQKDNIISTYLQGGQGNLSGTIVKSLKVDITTYDEQQAIGAYFRNLDNLITLHQRKLEKLQNIKKSMLEKMFVD